MTSADPTRSRVAETSDAVEVAQGWVLDGSAGVLVGEVSGSGKSELLRLLADKLSDGDVVAVVDAKSKVGRDLLPGVRDLLRSAGGSVADTDEVTAVREVLSANGWGVEAQCEDCGLVFTVAGVAELEDSVEARCRECGGVLVEVVGELLVDGSAGVLSDVVIPVDPHELVGLIDNDGRGAVA